MTHVPVMYVTSACLINTNEFMMCYLNNTSHPVTAFCVTLRYPVNDIWPVTTLLKALTLSRNVAVCPIYYIHYANCLDVVYGNWTICRQTNSLSVKSRTGRFTDDSRNVRFAQTHRTIRAG